ncbi:anti-sigma factor [Gracilibacillus massiliensis]|uniref:anti-sigma factor n=1 Tax=Gracilibacillus massiliensis TaxID=1564956 RepID=UPI00071E2F50|nr:anti-sigma factor [Gracilibacillus massiliensis]
MNKQCEQLIDYFNHQLDIDEQQRFEEHLESCETCQQELLELQSLTEDLPFISEPITPNQGMKNRVLNNVVTQPQEEAEKNTKEETDAKTVLEKPLAEETNKSKFKRKYSSFIQNGLAAALVLSLIGNIYLLNQPNGTSTEQEEAIDQILNVVSLQDTEIMDASGQASFIQNGEEKLLVVHAENLSDIDKEEAYQVWLLEGETPHRAGTFVPNDNGNGAVAFSLTDLEEADVNWDTIAITLEPNPNNQTPEGDIILAAGIEG